jgi:hypothetical protein
MMIAFALLLAPLLIAIPFAGRRRRSFVIIMILVAGFGLGAWAVQHEGRSPLVNLAVLALLLGLFRLAGAFEERGATSPRS